jgi:hypothetical protein
MSVAFLFKVEWPRLFTWTAAQMQCGDYLACIFLTLALAS